ncbi:MAG: DUF4339 domain-containing protein [Bdellovibrionales bacterium]|nr:DUF4339 domain-containing protein [Oligoflexia bacterium]
MNTENEKKWFVYVGDHHEGPFTPSEVHEKQKQGLVSKESYVWCEGMSDWLMLSEVKDLHIELKKLEQEDRPADRTNPKLERTNTKIILQSENSRIMDNPMTEKPVKVERSKAASIGKKGKPKSSKLPAILIICMLAVIVLGLGALSLASRLASDDLHTRLRPLLSRITDQVPALAPAFRLVPNLPDLNQDELHDLEDARLGSPEAGVKIAVASSLNDANRPTFYVSTNLPDRTKFDLYLVGNSETLLNRLQFSAQNTVTTVKGFGKSEVFLAEGGQLIPKGEYRLFLTESADQTEGVKLALPGYVGIRSALKTPPQVPANAHFLVVKTYFLGGPRDETYLTRLKAFHEKIKQTSQRELQELKQYSDTLNMQFSAMTTEFNRIHSAKKPSPGLRAAWKKDAATWGQINGQLDQTIQTWSKETLQNEFFYGKVYELVKNAYESVKSLFQIENNFIEGNPDRGGFEIQHGKALSEAREALELLQTKMELMGKAPATPSGIPTRDGL